MSNEKHRKWCQTYYEQLVGATVVGVQAKLHKDELYGEAPQVWTEIHCEARDGELFTLEISSDEEGNAPGFLFGLPKV